MKGSYPYGELALNTSKETTLKEIVSIDGIPEQVFRMENMGVSSGQVNAMSWCNNMMQMPTHEEVLVAFCTEKGIKPRVSFAEAIAAEHGKDAQYHKSPCALA